MAASSPSTEGFPVIAMAASAGGLGALKTILPALPKDLPAAVVIVLHRSAKYPSVLKEILALHTTLAVKEAEDGCVLQPGLIHLAPPDYHLLVGNDDRLRLSQGPKVNHVRPAADLFFRAAGKELGQRVIGVVLSGYDADGADGIKAIKEHGGMVIAQDERTAVVPGMPLSAIKTGEVDFIVPVGQISAMLQKLVKRKS